MSKYPYAKTLVVGATSGIGYALASRIHQAGGSVIVTGRREERLQKFANEHSSNSSSATITPVAIDITDISSLQSFVEKLIKEHPDLDCVLLNAGIQRGFDFTRPENVDLALLEKEWVTNYLSYMHLTKGFLPHLQRHASNDDKQAALVFVSSGLGLIPSPSSLNYSATKAALHAFAMALRAQLSPSWPRLKIVEIVPPAVETELHDYLKEGGGQLPKGMQMPLDDFTEEAWRGWVEEGKDEVFVGDLVRRLAGGWEKERKGIFDGIMARSAGRQRM